jgi:hypothetical protein
MGRLIRILSERETFGLRPIAGGVGGCPPPPPDPPSPPPPSPPSPSAIPAVVGTPAGAVAGSFWVEGAAWHYIASTGVEYEGTGAAVATPAGAVVGSYWVEGQDFHYVDASGVERTLQATSLGAKAGAALEGSFWVESAAAAGKQWQWTSATSRLQFWNGS